VYISNTGSATISVIDLNTLTITDTIDLTGTVTDLPGGNAQSHFFEVTKDGKYIWVGERQGTADGAILVVDIETKAVVKKFDVGAAIGQTLSQDGKWVFAVSNNKGGSYNNVINVFDVENQTHLGTIPHGSAPHVLETTPDSKTLWTTSAGGGTLVSYDITGLPGTVPTAPKKMIDVYQQLHDDGIVASDVTSITLHALVLHPDGYYAIVGSFDNGLTTGGGDVIIDLDSGDIVARVPGRPHNYDLSKDSKYLLSGESNAPDCEEETYLEEHQHNVTGPLVRLVDIDALSSASPDYSTVKVAKTIDSGSWGYNAINHQAYDPSGTYILITTSQGSGSSSEGKVVIVDAETLEEKASLTVGSSPHGINVPGHGR
jgi:DNA-binding beta-propeller fold protein YncE